MVPLENPSFTDCGARGGVEGNGLTRRYAAMNYIAAKNEFT